MKKIYSLFLLLFVFYQSGAQTILSTGLPSAPTTFSGSAPFGIAWTIENTNSFPIDITAIDFYRGSLSSGVTYSLYYNATSLTGSTNLLTTPGWNLIAAGTMSTVTTTAIHPGLTGLNFTMPANTTYRFAMNSSSNLIYCGTTTTVPNSYTGGGVTIGVGNYQISGVNVGFAGPSNSLSLNPYFWAGTIYFTPSAACVTPPNAGTSVVSNANPCLGSSINLSLTGHTWGLGQTYQWESSTTLSGPYTPVGSPTTSNSGSVTINASNTLYYRAAVTCSGNTSYSVPVLVTIPAPFPGGTYTINSALPTGSGNFASFSDAALAINCGTTGPIVLNVTPGTYNNDNFWLDHYINAPGVSVTINGNGATLSYLSSNANEPGIVRLKGTKNVTINNLKIQGISTSTTQYAWGVFMTNNADSNTISNCAITLDTTTTSSNYAGIVLSGAASSAITAGSGCDGITITNNVIKGGVYGITLMGNTSTGILQGNTITNNILRDFYNYGIYASYSNNMKIDGNDISRITRTSASTFGGIYMPTGHTNLLVNKNRVHDPAAAAPTANFLAYGIYLTGAATAAGPNIISNNLIYNFQGSGTSVHYGLYNSTGSYSRYYYNTVSFDYVPSTTTGLTHGFYQTGTVTASTVEFKNNNISITRGGTAAKYGIYLNTPANVIVSNYNNFYINGAGGQNFVGFKTTAHATLLDWQTNTTAPLLDANSASVDPQFASPAVGDYMPTNGALDNLGTPVSVLTDILNVTRSASTPDIGAYEFAVPACAGSPVAGTVSGPTSICSGINFSLNLSGYTIGTGISIQWQSSPAGQNNFSNIAGATNVTLNINQTSSTDYRAVVTCSNSAQFTNSNTYAVPMSPFYLCYCSPHTGTTLHTGTANYTTNVKIVGSSLNNTTSVVGAGGYTFADPAIASNTTTVFQGVQFTLEATQSTATANSEAWIDWDNSGTFDASEYYILPKTGLISSLGITPPIGTPLGMTGMRVRTEFSTTVTFGPGDACTNMSLGRETEDYVITVAPQPTCLPPSSLSATNVTTASATVNWASSPSTPVGGYDYYVNTVNVAPTATTPPSGNEVQGSILTNLINLNAGTTYYVWVRSVCSANDMSVWVPLPSFSTPPPNDPCSNAVDISNSQVFNGTTAGATQSDPACDATLVANDVWYSFTTGSIGGSVTVTVITTGVMDVVMQGFSGVCGAFTGMVPTASTTVTGTCIDGPAAGTEFGTYTVSPFTTYYVRVYGYLGAQGAFSIQATGAPLSIKLASISAVNIGSRNRVNWASAEEQKGDLFNVERSADGENYTTLATVNAKGQPSTYSYWDEAPVNSLNYYRLKMIDASGSFTYSSVVTAITRTGAFAVEAYPNPVSDVLTIKAFGTTGFNPRVIVSDVTGKTVTSAKIINNKAIISMNGLAPGVYMVKYTDGEHSHVIKVNKK